MEQPRTRTQAEAGVTVIVRAATATGERAPKIHRTLYLLPLRRQRQTVSTEAFANIAQPRIQSGAPYDIGESLVNQPPEWSVSCEEWREVGSPMLRHGHSDVFSVSREKNGSGMLEDNGAGWLSALMNIVLCYIANSRNGTHPLPLATCHWVFVPTHTDIQHATLGRAQSHINTNS